MGTQTNRALVLVPGFGGGSWDLVQFAPDAQDRGDLERIFGEVGQGILSPRMNERDAALTRADIVNRTIEGLDANKRVTIATYSGGGFVVRCAMSKLRHEKPDVYERVDFITVADGAVRGALFPISLFYLAKIGSLQGSPEGQVGLEVTCDHPRWAQRVIDFHATVPPALMLPLAEESLLVWANDVSPAWKNETRLEKSLDLRPHPNRTKLLNQLDAWDAGRPWGEGSYKVAYANGGREPFFDKNRELVAFVASKGSLGPT